MIFIREDLRTLLSPSADFESIMHLKGAVFSKGNNRRTFSIDLDNSHFFIKIHTGVGWKEIFKNIFQFKRPVISARNEWQAIKKLGTIGIPTMTAAAYGEKGKNPAKIESFIMTDALPDVLSLEKFCPEYFSGRLNKEKILIKRAIIKKIAEIARTIHGNGLNHQDFYICHFLIRINNEKITPETLKLFLIDLHRVMIRPKTPQRWIRKDLAGIYFSSMDLPLTKRDLFRFMIEYRHSSLKKIFIKEKNFWEKIEKRGKRIYKKISTN